MMKTKGRNGKKGCSLARPGLLGLVVLTLVISACSSSRRYKINLMPAPAVFEGGAINPLPKGQPPVSYDDFSMLYATDRKPSDDPDQRPFSPDFSSDWARPESKRGRKGPTGKRRAASRWPRIAAGIIPLRLCR